jgi:hypothetical protein
MQDLEELRAHPRNPDAAAERVALLWGTDLAP